MAQRTFNPPEFYRAGVQYRFRWTTRSESRTHIAYFDSWEEMHGRLYLIFTREPDSTSFIVATAMCWELSEVEEVTVTSVRIGE